MDEDQPIVDLIDEFSSSPPSQYFLRETTKDATAARAMNHALYCIIDQLRNPISLEAESFIKWIVYKQSAPHRHQIFFGMFRTLNKSVKKYNDMELIRRLNTVYKRAINSGDDHYLFEPAALRYIGAAYIRRLFILEQIQKYSVKTANCCMGMLELEHWANLSLVIVALCGEVHSETIKQVREMEKAYRFAAKILRNVDERFPNLLEEMEVVKRIKVSFDKEDVDISRITKLLKFTDEKISEAQTENKIDMLKSEIMNDLLNPKTPVKVSSVRPSTSKMDDSDFGISISRNDISAMNFEMTDEETLLSPMLFGKKKLDINIKKKKLKKKVKMAELDIEPEPETVQVKKNSSNGLENEEKPVKASTNGAIKNSFLASTLSLLSSKTESENSTKSKKKIKKKKKKLVASSVVATSSISPTVIKKIKKKKKKNNL